MDRQAEHEVHPEELTLLEYVVGELGPDMSDAIRRHVDGCPSCRERIVDLAMDVDEVDRLPTVAIPHDLLRVALPAARDDSTQRRRIARTVPILLLLAAALGVVALFQVGGMRAAPDVPTQQQLVLQTASDDPVAVVDALLDGIPHTVVTDRDDARHLVVLVATADLSAARSRLAIEGSGDGRSYVIDLGGTGQPPASAD